MSSLRGGGVYACRAREAKKVVSGSKMC